MKLLIIGNYPPLLQESMARVARSLYDGLREQPGIEAELWLQPERAIRLAPLLGAWSAKWLGYIDLYALTPVALGLRRLLRPADRYHICDHSDAPLSMVLPKGRTSITCHDVLAIQAAAGEREHAIEPTRLGRLQQRYIRHFLVRMPKVVSVSHYTQDQLTQVAKSDGRVPDARWEVIYNKFVGDFKPFPWPESLTEDYGLTRGRYLLHLGSGHPRKNRSLLIRSLRKLSPELSDLKVCLAGSPAEAPERSVIEAEGVAARVVYTGAVSHEVASALYTHCFAFLFPSLSEGFGLPIIEAQACGAPVIASRRAPMPEVAGDGALYADPHDADAFAAAVVSLRDAELRDRLVARGFENVKRFSPRVIDAEYVGYLGDA